MSMDNVPYLREKTIEPVLAGIDKCCIELLDV